MPTLQFKDYYEILGVARGADEKSLRTSYRALARKHHPDINPGDDKAEERFKEINEAFEVLSDPDKRKLYDRFGEDWQRYRDAGFTGDEPAGRPGRSRQGIDPNDFGAWFAGQQASRTGGGVNDEWTVHHVDADGDGAGFSDFFQTLFGGRGRSASRSRFGAMPASRPRRGEDAEVPVEVSFDEAFQGAKRTVQLQASHICPVCNGTGLVRETTCPRCDGAGMVQLTRTLEVTVPPGVATGSRIRVAGQGGAGEAGGPNGDVFLRVMVRPDPRFERDGNDLRTEVEVPLTTAVLGGEAVVSTPTGRVALAIPAETQAERLFRLRGQGMPLLKGKAGERGDLFARVRVSLPSELSDRERALFAELRTLRAEDGA